MLPQFCKLERIHRPATWRVGPELNTRKSICDNLRPAAVEHHPPPSPPPPLAQNYTRTMCVYMYMGKKCVFGKVCSVASSQDCLPSCPQAPRSHWWRINIPGKFPPHFHSWPRSKKSCRRQLDMYWGGWGVDTWKTIQHWYYRLIYFPKSIFNVQRKQFPHSWSAVFSVYFLFL